MWFGIGLLDLVFGHFGTWKMLLRSFCLFYFGFGYSWHFPHVPSDKRFSQEKKRCRRLYVGLNIKILQWLSLSGLDFLWFVFKVNCCHLDYWCCLLAQLRPLDLNPWDTFLGGTHINAHVIVLFIFMASLTSPRFLIHFACLLSQSLNA